jgi:hypothetical protein
MRTKTARHHLAGHKAASDSSPESGALWEQGEKRITKLRTVVKKRAHQKSKGSYRLDPFRRIEVAGFHGCFKSRPLMPRGDSANFGVILHVDEKNRI